MSPDRTSVQKPTSASARRRRRASDTFYGAERARRLADERACAPDELAVGIDLAVAAEIADEVPVQRRLVVAAAILEPHPEREVHRAADLLVEEDVPREAVDLVVEAERDFAEDAGAGVHVEQRVQVLLAARSLRLHHAPALEAQANV